MTSLELETLTGFVFLTSALGLVSTQDLGPSQETRVNATLALAIEDGFTTLLRRTKIARRTPPIANISWPRRHPVRVVPQLSLIFVQP